MLLYGKKNLKDEILSLAELYVQAGGQAGLHFISLRMTTN